MKRVLPTFAEEEKLWRRGCALIGTDEVGMGPLAGPVIAAAVYIQPPGAKDDVEELLGLGVRDSKLVSPKKRERIFQVLTAHSRVRWAAGQVDEKLIDRINILEAGLQAMRQAVTQVVATITKEFPSYGSEENLFVMVDGRNIIPDLIMNQKSVIDGDAKIFSIAAASIIAKVLRDRLMCEYAKKYPEYQFEKHKGYGTKLHYALLKKHGISPLHRRSFLKKMVSTGVLT